jgi:hypothetical protein
MSPRFRPLVLSASILAVIGSAAVSSAQATPAAAPPTIKIYRHSAWSDVPPKGVDCHGVRQNLAPGASLKLDGLTLTLTAAEAAPEGATATPDKATMTLVDGDATETRTVNEGDAFNWRTYHIAVPVMHLAKGELGFGCTVVEAATIASLPERVATSTKANGASDRLRVTHTIDKLTLHHSATSHVAGDDIAKKLKNMQSWGENDRNWFDVPYHFFVDLDGSVYQARDYKYAGDTNTRYDPAGHFLVNCFGDYEKAEPNEKQLQTVAALFAWAAAENRIAPIKIYGHKDLAQTGCPGKNLYKHIEDGSLQKRVEDILKTGTPKLEWHDTLPTAAEAAKPAGPAKEK